MGRWIKEKLQEWLILVVGLAAIPILIGIGAQFQSGSEPPVSVAAAPATPDGPPKPMAATAAPSAKQTAVAPSSAKQGVEGNNRADSKQSSDNKATARAAPALQTAQTGVPAAAAPAPPPAQAPPPIQTAQTPPPAAPMTHDHAPAARTTGQSGRCSRSTGDDRRCAAGRQVFQKCRACHSLDAGKNGVGPSLANIVGEKAAAVPGYNFSPAMKASNLTWDAATLDAYLADPQKVVPGNKMPFPGLKTERERSAIIALLTRYVEVGRRRRLHQRRRHRRLKLAAPSAAPSAAGAIGLVRRQSRGQAMCPGSATHFAPESPKAAWCSSASAARSTVRSIPCCPPRKARSFR